jgi:hypothetical protein
VLPHKSPLPPFEVEDSLVLLQDLTLSQLGASSVSLCSGVSTQPSLAPSPERGGGQMVVSGDFVTVPPLAWVTTSQSSSGVSPPRPPLFVAPSSRCPCDVHPKSKPEACISCSGLVVGCDSFVVGIDQVALCCSSGPRLELVKFVKRKPPEVILLVLSLLRVASGRHHRRARLAA